MWKMPGGCSDAVNAASRETLKDETLLKEHVRIELKDLFRSAPERR